MAYLENIIQRIETTFQVHVHGNTSDNRQIENVQYLIAKNEELPAFQPETLYIGNYQDFHQYSLEGCILLLNCRISSGNENGLYIYQALDPFLVCNCIQEELFQSHKIQLKKEEMFQVLQAGYGIQSILDTARIYLENPITLCTTSFSVLAVSPKRFSDDKFDSYNNKLYLRKSFVQNMKEKQVLHHIFSSSSPLIATFEDSPGVEYLFCSVHINHAAVGYLCLNSSLRPFQKEDAFFVMDLAKMISIEMQKDDFFNEKSGLKYEYFLTDLVEQNFLSLDFATNRLAQLGYNVYQYFWVLGFTFTGSSNNRMNSNYYIDQLLGIFKHSMVFFYKGNLILLLTSKYQNPYKKVDKQKLFHFLQFNQMYAAISFRYENLLDTHRYYHQVAFLLRSPHGRIEERMFSYEDNYLSHLLDSAQNVVAAETLLHPDIRFLSQYDRDNHTEYIETLRAYFQNNRNALQASKQLHIHKSTFFYRMGKIEDLTDFDMENTRLLFSYEFSFYLLDYMETH
ncbi:PucR family transcriptional regulator [Konateibacter massiliensis]|uniref:PucR family transcriptional regulator n=1 Tax=Konateibacter massiliensis TaxID=2002841 RepID=UPI000C1585D0|nr:helix-turn-helix domain-containing protein [Konateibacter massiliensis]